MYTDFYDLREKPFDLSPSSRFLYLGETHKEALALLTYGVRERQGFGLLTGEVGTGKTTIIHALLAGMDRNVHLVHLSNPLLSPREFLEYLARKALGREGPLHSKAEFLIDFETFLMDCLKSGKNFLLIIDEAHRVSFELLEEIRLLSNMETAEAKLMGIFLVGQPELRERLKDPRCEALLQRITTHYHLTPLDRDSTGEYIRTRLRAAGAKTPDKILRQSVIERIHQLSKGYPRRINSISDNLLLSAFAQGKRKITPEMVTECYREMNMEAPPAGREEAPPPERQREAAPGLPATRWKRPAFATGLAATVALVLAIGFAGTGMWSRTVGVKPRVGQKQAGDGKGPGESTLWGPENHARRASTVSGLKETAAAEAEEPPGTLPVQEPADSPVTASPASLARSAIEEEAPPPPEEPESPPGHISLRTRSVEEGQTLRELALETYGEADEAVLAMLKEANPAIDDINLIEVGQTITFPPLSGRSEGTDDPVAAVVRVSVESKPALAPVADIYHRIDRDCLRSLKDKDPVAYMDFWEGLLRADRRRGSTNSRDSATEEDTRKRISHFLQAASDMADEAASRAGTAGVLHPETLKAYSELSSLEPSSYTPLLRDSVIFQEKWQADVELIRALQGPDGAEKEEETNRLLLIIRHPNARPRELHTLGYYALETGWLQGAIAAFDRIVADQNPDYQAYNNRAVAYLRNGEIERARKDLNRAIEKNPSRPEAFNNMGMIYLREEAYEDAATYFLHAAKVDPSFQESLLNAAVLYGECLKNGEKATSLAREYLDRGGSFQRQMLMAWLGES